jgi:hypothetical protein
VSAAVSAEAADAAILDDAQRHVLLMAPAAYARHAAASQLEQRCEHAEAHGGVGCAVGVAARRVAQIDEMLEACGDVLPAANLRTERRLLRRLVLDPADRDATPRGHD